MSELRSIQAEWNALVPVAHSLGIYSGVRVLRSVHENVAHGRARLAWLHARIAARQPRTATSAAALNLSQPQGDTFGVEIELIMPQGMSRVRLAQIITDAGIACHAEGYNHRTGNDWKIVEDGSLGSRLTGAEVVSPILSGEEGFANMTKVMNAVRTAGCKVNKSCGFHVHIGARAENVQFFRHLAKIYRHFDGAINSVLAPSRAYNQFCYAHTINAAALDNAVSVDEVTRAVGQMPGREYVRSSYRYRKLNFCSFWQHGTVEFRQHQGTVEAEKATQWVKFCFGLVAAARLNAPIQGDTLADLMTVVGATPTQAAYFTSRQALFAQRASRAA
jgi:Putative amidoligase enzyme